VEREPRNAGPGRPHFARHLQQALNADWLTLQHWAQGDPLRLHQLRHLRYGDYLASLEWLQQHPPKG
jgi:hypothetical protein